MTVNNKWPWYLAILPLLLGFNAQANSLCANGNENSAITASTPNTAFSDNGDGTVTHHTTGLIWQRCSLGQSWNGSDCIGSADGFTWGDASLAAAAQNTFAGFSDWRLPNKNELASIVEYRCFLPAINSQQFPNAPASWYWSSSPTVIDSRLAWGVSFHYGPTGFNDKSNSFLVRLVRDPLGEPSGEPGIEIINGAPENRKEERTSGQ
ncbi:DUF1566 domain-containing protein [Vibrio cholerae]|uniref:Lcl C-terminal domain-containing protein n=1 Tax=Vibrio cholerae TaxID=666 RepID=UPI00115B2E01|nr:DUF1566 domain-containing protein [Vibrio cholerae]TQO60990.1 DUF1566 domain-containing protein [Vibrio cholerae]